MIRIAIGLVMCLFSITVATASCLRVPRNLRRYYRPGYIALGVAGTLAGTILILSVVL